jgi:hypothetical protein
MISVTAGVFDDRSKSTVVVLKSTALPNSVPKLVGSGEASQKSIVAAPTANDVFMLFNAHVVVGKALRSGVEEAHMPES